MEEKHKKKISCKLWVFIILLLPMLPAAANNIQCMHLPFLAQGFNFSNYKHCQTLIHQCPASGPLPDSSCAEKVSKKNRVCKQTRELSKKIGMPITVLEAKQLANFIIVTVYFLADGQEQSYIITPQSCLIDTNIDPRKFSKDFAKKYRNTSFFIVNWGKPHYQIHSNGTQSFRVLLRLTNTCLACSVIGFAEVRFNFAKDGKLIGIALESFKHKLRK
jgi:hypothetical protein